MNTTGRSTLLTKTFQFIGFGFDHSPTNAKDFVQLSFYQDTKNTSSILLCLSTGRGKGSRELAKSGLGLLVKGSEIAPFAQRGFENIDLATLKQIAKLGWPHITFEWEN